MFSMDEILDVLSNPTRRRILELLSLSSKPVAYTSIWKHFDLSSTGSLNHHLQTLAEHGLIVRQSSGYVLTPRGKIAHAVSMDLEDSFRRHVLGKSPGGGEEMGREISVKPVEKGDVFGLVLKAGTMTSKGPLTEERVKKELEENRQQWLEMEAIGIHGRSISSVVSLIAVENDHAVGNISGREQRIGEVDLHKIVVDNIVTLGDPVVSKKLVSGLMDYAKKRGAKSVLFCLNDPEDADEAAIMESGGKLWFEAKHRCFALSVGSQEGS